MHGVVWSKLEKARMQELLAVTDATGECMVGSACNFLGLAHAVAGAAKHRKCLPVPKASPSLASARGRSGTKLVLVACVAGYSMSQWSCLCTLLRIVINTIMILMR